MRSSRSHSWRCTQTTDPRGWTSSFSRKESFGITWRGWAVSGGKEKIDVSSWLGGKSCSMQPIPQLWWSVRPSNLREKTARDCRLDFCSLPLPCIISDVLQLSEWCGWEVFRGEHEVEAERRLREKCFSAFARAFSIFSLPFHLDHDHHHHNLQQQSETLTTCIL